MSVESMTERIDEVTKLVTTLSGDLVYSGEEIALQRHRRSYVRGVFALIEGTVFGLKSIVLESLDVFGANLDPGERALLNEQSYLLRDDGTVRAVQQFIKIADNLRFTLGLGTKAFGVPIQSDYSGEGWAGLKAGVLVRNRLLHPKHSSDLDVGDDELATIAKAIEWFKQSAVTFMLGAREAAVRKGRTSALAAAKQGR